jgi:hypothetical protein
MKLFGLIYKVRIFFFMERQGQSKLGIASLLISIFTAIGLFIVTIIAGVIESNSYGGIDEESAEAIILGLFIFGFGFLDLVALGLGIGGIFQKTRARITAIIGTVVSSATLIITVSLIGIGLAIS